MTEEEKRQLEMSEEMEKQLRQERNRTYEALTAEQRDFVEDYDGRSGGYLNRKPVNSAMVGELRRWLKNGKKPSVFFEQKCGWLFDGYILPRKRGMFLYTVDHMTRWQYGLSMWRRSFRTGDYEPYLDKMLVFVSRLHSGARLDASLADMLTLRLPERECAYLLGESGRWYGYEEEIAYELDRGNREVMDALKDIMDGESRILINREFIRGILMSGNAEMHEYLGKLLLAARVQEGLRQVICENADCGTVEAFLSIFRVIKENNLIRFSAVKRAVGTWTGLMEAGSVDIERGSGKTVELISACLLDEKQREAYLGSEDCMEIYLALWAYGFYELRDAAARFEHFVESGTRHQLLTTGYFVANLDAPSYAGRLAKKVLLTRSEPDILAVFMPCFMEGWMVHGRRVARDGGDQDVLLKRYFESREDAEECYDRLKELLGGMKKKMRFSPCIFPWYSASLDRSDFIGRMCLIACMLHDNTRLDECIAMMKECDAETRRSMIDIALRAPETKVQKAALVEALCDKDSYNRGRALQLMDQVALTEEHYLQMEQMLRFKAADMRSALINLLYQRGDGEVFGTAKRLIEDKQEEKRAAGLDILIRLSKDEGRQELFTRCRPLAGSITNPTTREKILIESITGAEEKEERPALFTEEDVYRPYVPDNAFTLGCVKKYMAYFPDSELGSLLYPKQFKKSLVSGITKAVQAACASYKQVLADFESLRALIVEHRKDEFVSACEGEVCTLDCEPYQFREKLPEGGERLPLYDLWVKWYTENIKCPERLFRMETVLAAYAKESEFTLSTVKYVESLFGKGYAANIVMDYRSKVARIVSELCGLYVTNEDLVQLMVAAELWFMKAVPDEDVMVYRKPRYNRGDTYFHLITHSQLHMVFQGAYFRCDDSRNSAHCMDLFALDLAVYERCMNDKHRSDRDRMGGDRLNSENGGNFVPPSATAFLYHAYRGMIPERTLYARIFKGGLKSCLSIITDAVSLYREEGRSVSKRNVSLTSANYYYHYYRMDRISGLLGHRVSKEEPVTDEDRKLLAYVDQIYETVIPIILETELKRGDSPTIYSSAIDAIQRIYGAKNFVAILAALGREPLERSCVRSSDSKKSVLSHLLTVCIPDDMDGAEKLGKLLKETDITEKRLIEAGMYAPEWLGIVEEYLGWQGFRSACYYFMAHMNEHFDDRRTAIIAKYTPLTPDELQAGAFDIEWFRTAYGTLGEKRFNMIYDAAKYISDGAKHSRARKYADAALGKYDPKTITGEISEKRNKDLLMAYAVIPLGGEDDLCDRYLFLQHFLKESKKFGSQRAASEKKAVETAMQNLATNAGYADTMRLTLRMETKLVNDSQAFFADQEVEDVVVRLAVDETGKSNIICTKDGKELKAVPARLKKNEYLVRLGETKKKLTEQYSRARRMFEQAMEDGERFTVEEINTLLGNPVISPILCNLVYQWGDKTGFFDGRELVDYAGKRIALKPEDQLCVAHPFVLYSEGHWADYQRNLFERQRVQPFKQVFRELYVKTAEEMEMMHSLRYAGNQIQPAKTVACLKGRRWVADVEDGLQKVYYRENIVARIYAMADWFSPADIEAPTLEWVEFSNRKTGRGIEIKAVPDVIFSEVMRDVDLAVSVAHAGGVDPETSHSTMEMRAALLEYTLPLFKLTNVEIRGSHAHIKGKLAEYTLHLGSGVVHRQGGAMIPILPVHSQHRGRLFLPFADDDPKTAEILSKAILLAEDYKIKDPMILEQIRG